MQKFFSYIFLLATILLCNSCKVFLHNTTTHQYILIGTYTTNNESKRIYVYDFDEETGTLKEISHTENVANPSYLTFSKDEKFVYAVNENIDNTTQGMVSAFAFNKNNGILKLLNSVASNGDAPCFISIDKSGKNVMAANYNGGNFSVYKTDEDGKLLS